MRIVLIESSPADVRWFRLMAAETGIPCDITTFSRSIDALDHLVYADPPDTVIMNWRQPVLTFPEFVRLLRAIPGYERTPIAILTGDLQALGMTMEDVICCLPKPISAEQLQSIFNQILETQK